MAVSLRAKRNRSLCDVKSEWTLPILRADGLGFRLPLRRVFVLGLTATAPRELELAPFGSWNTASELQGCFAFLRTAFCSGGSLHARSRQGPLPHFKLHRNALPSIAIGVAVAVFVRPKPRCSSAASAGRIAASAAAMMKFPCESFLGVGRRRSPLNLRAGGTCLSHEAARS